MAHLFTPTRLGAYSLTHRVVLAPMTYLREHFAGPIIAAGGFDGESAEAIVASGDADLVAFGRHFSSNPDLPYRLEHKLPLTPYVREVFWGGDEKHYSDFPAHQSNPLAETTL